MSGDLAGLLKDFFETYLCEHRALSPNTIKSYRDSFKLLIRHIRSRHPNCQTLTIRHLEPRAILDFLQNLEDPNGGRGNSARTRNHRLAAIHSFFKYLCIHRPSLERHCKTVLAIPSKKASQKAVEHLSRKELEALLAQPRTTTSDGIRDLAILLFLYNTGARAQEVADVRLAAFDFPNCIVTIHGKGNKDRINPLWPATVKLLELYRDQYRRKPQPPAVNRFFVNQRGLPFTRFGIRTIVKKYLCCAARGCPSIAGKRLSTHSMRHTFAVHLCEQNVDPTVVKDLLGHARLSSGDPYRNTSLQHKRRILEQYGPPSYVASVLEPKPQDSPERLLGWLDHL